MTKAERKKMVCAMEYIARHINHEGVFEKWLMLGVADGDIELGDMDAPEAEYYAEPDVYRELCDVFLDCMREACTHGGLI